MAAVGEERWEAMARFAVLSIEDRRALGDAAGSRYPKQRLGCRRREQDDVVPIPRAATTGQGVTQHHRRSSGDADLLQLSAGEETDEAAIGRPERERRVFSARERAGVQAGDRSQPQLIAVRTACDERESAAVRRYRDLRRHPGAAAGRRGKRRVGWWRDRELKRIGRRSWFAHVAKDDGTKPRDGEEEYSHNRYRSATEAARDGGNGRWRRGVRRHRPLQVAQEIARALIPIVGIFSEAR